MVADGLACGGQQPLTYRPILCLVAWYTGQAGTAIGIRLREEKLKSVKQRCSTQCIEVCRCICIVRLLRPRPEIVAIVNTRPQAHGLRTSACTPSISCPLRRDVWTSQAARSRGRLAFESSAWGPWAGHRLRSAQRAGASCPDTPTHSRTLAAPAPPTRARFGQAPTTHSWWLVHARAPAIAHPHAYLVSGGCA